MQKIGRNDLCHCGSGKKYKNCHQGLDQNLDNKKGASINKVVIIVLAVFITLIAIGLYFTFSTSEKAGPEGKVWSEEHGHYHDVQ